MVGRGGWLGCSDDTQKEITSLRNGLHRFDAFQLLMPSEGAGKILGVSYGPPFISNLKSMYIVNWGLRWVEPSLGEERPGKDDCEYLLFFSGLWNGWVLWRLPY